MKNKLLSLGILVLAFVFIFTAVPLRVLAFTPATDSTTANTVPVLGLVGTSVSSDTPAVATADLTTATGFVTITSVSEGTATITVSDSSTPPDTTTIALTVNSDGSITIGTIKPYSAPTPPIPTPISIHLTITTKTSSVYDQTINVNACNSDNGATTNLKITAYCAILQSRIQNDWNWSWPPGAFLNSLDGIASFTTKDNNNNDVYHYWDWSLNGAEGTMGLNEYELQPNDLISLTFIDPQLTPAPTPVSESSSGGYLAPKIKPIFDSQKALDFLLSQQKSDGSFGDNIDWATLALASNSATPKTNLDELTKYYSGNLFSGNSLTDYERHAMALMALGLNPYNTNGENYIDKITSSFDGKQFGDATEDNDDIFALIVLQNAGFAQTDKMINNDISFVLEEQKADGSWDESVDMTGAGIEALASFNNNDQIKNSLSEAKNYLQKNQNNTGGWTNVSSTSWAMEGILALGDKLENWINNGNTPVDYLATNQGPDGSINDQDANTKIWETSYAISSLSGKTWNQIMQQFKKPEETAATVTKQTQNSPTPVVKSANISVSDKKIQNPAKNSAKVKTESLPNQNTNGTIVVNTAIPEPQTATPQKSWFTKLLDKVFSVF